MRPIKFRAWHTREKKMYPVRTWYFDAASHQIELEGKPVIEAFTIGEDVEITQFTGLLDRTGKEIWEGDIVRSSNGAYISRIEDIHAFCGETGLYGDDADEVEIIGNIYENPGLLATGGQA